MFINHVSEAKFVLCVKNLCCFVVNECPILLVIVDIAIIEYLIVLAVKVHLILCPTFLAHIYKRFLISDLWCLIVFEVERVLERCAISDISDLKLFDLELSWLKCDPPLQSV